MQKVIVQVPMTKKLRDAATRAAKDSGFSSLQEVIRLFTTKLAKKQVSIDISGVEYLTPQEDAILEKRYKEFLAEKKKGKTYKATSAKEMIRQLTS
ncbi:hypothetical protein IID21_00350 [Patescibacteria group bacterium]|nr:hypothetical protein [Patescibacteria group bacterium]